MKLIHKIAKYLGVDLDSAALYYNILLHKTLKDAELSKGNIHSIEVLESLCLISEFSERSADKLFFPIDPSFSFPAILIREMWKRDNRLHCFKDLIDSNDYEDLKYRYKLCYEILNILTPLYSDSVPFLSEMVTIVRGKEKIASYLSNLINATAEEIKAAVSPPFLLGEVIWQAIQEKIKSGLKYKRISVFSELNKHGYEVYKNEVLNCGVELFIYKKPVLPQKFYIINNLTFMFFTPTNNEKQISVQVINNEGFAKRYLNVFDDYLNESIELNPLIEKINKLRSQRLEQVKQVLTHDEYAWFEELFDFGRFSNFNFISDEVQASAKNKCLQNEFIEEIDNVYVAKYTLEEILQL